MDLYKLTVKFEVNGSEVEFSVVHNFPPDVQGLSMEDAVNAWLMRTNEYTQESFINYVKSKRTGFSIWSLEEAEKMKFKGKKSK